MISNISCTVHSLTKKIKINFTTDRTTKVSAGLFDKATKALITPIFSAIEFDKGKNTYTWNKADIFGAAVEAGDYEMQLAEHSLNAEWEGTLTSSHSNAKKHEGFDKVSDVCIGTGSDGTEYIFLAKTYWEKQLTQGAATTADPNTAINPLIGDYYGAACFRVCSKSNLVYWQTSFHENNDYQNAKIFFVIVAHNIDTKELYTFPTGTNYPINHATYSTIGIDTIAPKNIAVQKGAGTFLFQLLSNNTIKVFNATSGQAHPLINTSADAQWIAADGVGNLWVLYPTSATKHTVNSDGSISASVATINGLTEAKTITVSENGNTVLIADGGTSQQIKFYDGNGTLVKTEGAAGGYTNGPAVTQHKYAVNNNSAIAIQADGKYWVNEQINNRVIRNNVDDTFNNQILYIPASRHVTVDKNNNKRYFSDLLEFERDYSKPWDYESGGWKLTYNWSNTIGANAFQSVVTYPFGTYALTTGFNIVRLDSTGLQATNANNLQKSGLYPSGLYTIDEANVGAYATTYFRTFAATGTNVTLGDYEVFTRVLRQSIDPVYSGNPSNLCTGEVTEDGIHIMFEGQGGQQSYESQLYHLGGIKVADKANGNNKWLWKNAAATGRDYIGEWPEDGRYNNGGYSNGYVGSVARATGKLALMWLHNEFFFQGASNRGQFYLSNGLYLFGIGTDNRKILRGLGDKEFAGNAITIELIKLDEDTYYVIHGAEASNSGIHSWIIKGVSSIETYAANIVVTQDNIENVENETIDLVEGIPSGGVMDLDNLAAPTYFTRSASLINGASYVRYRTGLLSYDTRNVSLETNLEFPHLADGTFTIPSLPAKSSWSFTFRFAFIGSKSETLLGGSRGCFQILDTEDKVIADIDFRYQEPHSELIAEVAVNGKTAFVPFNGRYDVPFSKNLFVDALNECTITYAEGFLQFVINTLPPIIVPPLEVSSTPANVSVFRMFVQQKNDYVQPHSMIVDELSFSYTKQRINQAAKSTATEEYPEGSVLYTEAGKPKGTGSFIWNKVKRWLGINRTPTVPLDVEAAANTDANAVAAFRKNALNGDRAKIIIDNLNDVNKSTEIVFARKGVQQFALGVDKNANGEKGVYLYDANGNYFPFQIDAFGNIIFEPGQSGSIFRWGPEFTVYHNGLSFGNEVTHVEFGTNQFAERIFKVLSKNTLGIARLLCALDNSKFADLFVSQDGTLNVAAIKTAFIGNGFQLDIPSKGAGKVLVGDADGNVTFENMPANNAVVLDTYAEIEGVPTPANRTKTDLLVLFDESQPIDAESVKQNTRYQLWNTGDGNRLLLPL